MQRLATALVLCTLAGCASDAGNAPTATDPTTTQPGAAKAPAAPAAGTAQAGAAAPSGAQTTAASGSATPASTPAASSGQPAAQMQPTAASAPLSSATTTPAVGAMTAPAMSGAPAATPAKTEKKLAMDECKLKTPYAGDEYCILPPPADKGFQIHVGPSDYNNPSPEFVLQPGEENVVDMNATSGNDKMIYYYWRQYRMRPGSHHVIVTGNGRRLGGTQNLAKDNPDFGEIPPENMDVGLPLEAHTDINLNMHYYNFTDKPIIREVWVNFWYKNPADVKEPTKEVFSPTGVSAAVAHSHVVVGASCPVTGDGRLLSLYGHRHLNNVRFSVFHNRGSERKLILEDYESEHPSVFEFNSLAMNNLPDPKAKHPGAVSGILEIKAGDTLDFECEIVNKTDKNFTGANEAADDEMCILVGDAVGASLQPFCTPAQSKMLSN